MAVLFATSNRGKLADARKILGMEIEQFEEDLPEIQSMDRHEIAREKASEAFARAERPVFIVDTSLSFPALNGFPGPLIKWFWETVGAERICRIINSLSDNRVSAIVTIGYADSSGITVFDGETRGTVPDRPRGSNGFAWDNIFIPDGYDRTFAEMSHDEKVGVFSANPAWKRFREFLIANGINGSRP